MQDGEWKELEVVVPREYGAAAAHCQQPLPSAAASAQGFITEDVCKLKLQTWECLTLLSTSVCSKDK